MPTNVQRRGGHRGQVTKIIAESTTELCKPNPDQHVLDTYKEELLRQLQILDSLDEEILEDLVDDAAINKEI